MGSQNLGRSLNLTDVNFVEDVKEDLKCFVAERSVNSVLVFPPVSNYRRFLIHQCVEELGLTELASFSIGAGDERRTVICFREKLLCDVACSQPAMGLKPDEDAPITQHDAAVGGCKSCKPAQAQPTQPQGKIRSGPTKPRRPDRAVYVPRALRNTEAPTEEKLDKLDTKRPSLSYESPPKRARSPAVKEKSAHNTPRKSQNKSFCNIYKPPPLRNQRSHTSPCISDPTSEPISDPISDPSSVPTSELKSDATKTINGHLSELQSNPKSETIKESLSELISDPISELKSDPISELKSDPISETKPVPSACQVQYETPNLNTLSDNVNEIEIEKSFYIGDYYSNGQLGGFYVPDTTYDKNKMAAIDTEQKNIIDNKGYLYKDEDVEKNELRRASQEINRSSKRIIKQSFDSDVLVISDPVEDVKKEPLSEENSRPNLSVEPKQVKLKLETKVSLKREDNDWDAVFDETGECLDPSLLEELTSTVGKVHISKTKNNYDQYQTKGQALFNGPIDETFAHVIEVYDFPCEFKTNDLLSLFSEYKDTGFEIKWVDDTHALIVFSSAKIAADVLSSQRPMAKCRPLHAATLESRNKAKKCAEFLQPYRQRPETCTALARRLVSGALGVKLSTARQERAEERRLITIAREKKRQAALHKEAAWDGSLANQSASDT